MKNASITVSLIGVLIFIISLFSGSGILLILATAMPLVGLILGVIGIRNAEKRKQAIIGIILSIVIFAGMCGFSAYAYYAVNYLWEVS